VNFIFECPPSVVPVEAPLHDNEDVFRVLFTNGPGAEPITTTDQIRKPMANFNKVILAGNLTATPNCATPERTAVRQDWSLLSTGHWKSETARQGRGNFWLMRMLLAGRPRSSLNTQERRRFFWKGDCVTRRGKDKQTNAKRSKLVSYSRPFNSSIPAPL